MDSKRVIIVTGANSGVGLDTAKRLCSLGHDVVVSVRDDAKGQATIEAIKEVAPSATITYLTMELTDPQSIRDFVDKFRATGKTLNVLVNNAGLFKSYTDKTRYTARNDPDLEVTMVANCMGPFLLTNLLLEDLKASATPEIPSRIVNVSSMITSRVPRSSSGEFFYIDDLMLTKPGNYKSGFHSYRNSKVAMNLWANELAVTLKDSNVTINSVCPGFIPNTGLARDNTGGCMKCMLSLLDTCFGRCCINTKPVSHGSDRVMELVCDDVIGKSTGIFYVYGKIRTEAPEVLDKTNQEKIWALCEKYSGI